MIEPKQVFTWVYICSAYKGNVAENTRKAMMYCEFAVAQNRLPICPHIYFTRFMNDNDHIERAMGMMFGLDMMIYCKEMWVFGTTTPGMQQDIDRARDIGIRVRRCSDKEVEEFMEKYRKEADNA